MSQLNAQTSRNAVGQGAEETLAITLFSQFNTTQVLPEFHHSGAVRGVLVFCINGCRLCSTMLLLVRCVSECMVEVNWALCRHVDGYEYLAFGLLLSRCPNGLAVDDVFLESSSVSEDIDLALVFLSKTFPTILIADTIFTCTPNWNH